MSSSEPRRLSRLSSLLHCCLSTCVVPQFVLLLEDGSVVGPAVKKKNSLIKAGSASESTTTFNLLSNEMKTQGVSTELKPNVFVFNTISCLIIIHLRTGPLITVA